MRLSVLKTAMFSELVCPVAVNADRATGRRASLMSHSRAARLRAPSTASSRPSWPHTGSGTSPTRPWFSRDSSVTCRASPSSDSRTAVAVAVTSSRVPRQMVTDPAAGASTGSVSPSRSSTVQARTAGVRPGPSSSRRSSGPNWRGRTASACPVGAGPVSSHSRTV
nr:hypothetical protein GCM10020092_073420 [Actinoplanes digitatis]